MAKAKPCLPEERLPINLIGSIGSRVPPAVMIIFLPTKSEVATSASLIALMILVLSGYRPTPTSVPVIRPSSGSTTINPRLRKVSTFSVVAGLSHISVCIAGTKTFGAVEARTILVSRSSDRPVANLASRSAVAGAITIRSFSLAIDIWGTFSTSLQRSK